MKAQDVEEALLAEVAALASTGPRDRELAKAKNLLIANYAFELASVPELAAAIARAEIVEGDHWRFLARIPGYNKVTAADIKRVAATHLARERTTVVILTPGHGPSGEVEPKRALELPDPPMWPTAERFTNVPPASTAPIALPRIVRKKLDNGLQLVVAERRGQPIVLFDLVVPGGDLFDPQGKAGLARLVAAMLTQGTRSRTAEQVAEEAEYLGGSVGARVFDEVIHVWGRFLARDFEAGLTLLVDVAINPALPAAELERVRPQQESWVRRDNDLPASVAREHLLTLIFGPNHPRGRPVTLETLQQVTIDDIRGYYQRAFKPQGSFLVVVGDVQGEVALTQLEQAFRSWPGQGERLALPAYPVPHEGKRLRVVHRPDLTQTNIAVGHLAVPRASSDYRAWLLGNHILGGSKLASRLSTRIRQKGGKTYSAKSHLNAGRTGGEWTAETFTSTSETSVTLKMLIEEITAMHDHGVSEEELQLAKNGVLGSFAAALQPPWGLAEQLARAEFIFGEAEQRVRTFPEWVGAAKASEVSERLVRLLRPNDLALVLVGRSDKLASDVAGIGEFEVVE